MVPGLDVAQINSNTWAISARGFNLQFANKLLVLIDGRDVYSPLFGGVNWDTEQVPLEDIERIEVIRGPGSAVWGINAVNGVINIITKKASDTQGVLLVAGGGTHEQGLGTAQYGGDIGGMVSYRVFTNYLNDDHFLNAAGQGAFDGWHLLHSGFRIDTTKLSGKLHNESFTLLGDIYSGDEGSTLIHAIVSPPENVDVQRSANLWGGNVQARWSHTFSDRSDVTLHFYFDRYAREGPESSETRNTLDSDFQDHLHLGKRNDLIWGAGYQNTADQTVGTIDQAFVPAAVAAHEFNAFAQDEITLKPRSVFLYLGVKAENAYYTGYDWEPGARVAWTVNDRHTLWAAITRANRAPSRRDTGLDAVVEVLPGPAEEVLLGNPGMESEHVWAYELGYRAQVSNGLSVDVSGFFNVYDHLESQEQLPSFVDTSTTPAVTIFPSEFQNHLFGTTEGLEAFANWDVTRRWTLNPGYSFLEMHLHTDPTSSDTTSVADTQGSSPSHQAQLRSRFRLSRKLTWDTNAYFVGRLAANAIPSYTRLDLQLTWRLAPRLQLNVVGQNLLQDHHFEFTDTFQSVDSSQIKRSGYAKLTWQFGGL